MDSTTLTVGLVIYAAVAISMIGGCMFNWAVDRHWRDALLALTGWAWPLWLLYAVWLMVRDVWAHASEERLRRAS